MLRIQIRTIDGYGFTGRDPHPTADMIGQTGTVLTVTTYCAERRLTPDEWTPDLATDPDVVQILDTRLDDGRVVQLIAEEVTCLS